MSKTGITCWYRSRPVHQNIRYRNKTFHVEKSMPQILKTLVFLFHLNQFRHSLNEGCIARILSDSRSCVETENQNCKIQKRSIVFKSRDTEKVYAGLNRRKKVYSVEENKLEWQAPVATPVVLILNKIKDMQISTIQFVKQILVLNLSLLLLQLRFAEDNYQGWG